MSFLVLCTWNAALVLLPWLLHIRTLLSTVLWHDCNLSELCVVSSLSLSPSATQHTHPRLYRAGSIANIPRSTTAVLQCTPGFHGNSRCPPASTLHRTFFFIPSSTCLDVLRGLFAKHSIENGDDGGWCGAGWKDECITLLCFTIFLFKWSSSAVYFEPALHAQHRVLRTTILWHSICARGGVTYVLRL